jgi:CheY-like chemotaxis protein
MPREHAGLRAARLEYAGDERSRVSSAIARRIRAGQPPVVFCTTETEMSAIELAITNGAQEYIMKPFDEEILVGKLEQVGLL